jgi:hypothetical protein
MNATATATGATDDDAQFITNINGYALCSSWADGLGRIRDEELAERLDYGRPRVIRDLIRRLEREGKLNNIHQCRTVRLRADGRPSKPATVYWLTESQALKVIAKSETAKADAILDEVIAVFVAWRHGRWPANDNGLVEAVAAIAGTVAKLVVAVDSVAKRVSFLETHITTNGMISGPRLCELRASIRLIARLETEGGKWSSTSRASADIYRELREVSGWGGKGQPWQELPQQLECKVFPALRNREGAARHLVKAKQTEMGFGSN